MSKPGTIGNDVQDEALDSDGYASDSDAVDALLKRWMPDGDTDRPSGKKTKETTEDAEDETDGDEVEDDTSEEEDDEEQGSETDPDAEQADDETEGDEEEEEGDDEAETHVASDDHVVEVAVDGETKRVSVKDLKRLFGQEAALTRKSQEVSTARKKAEDDGARASAALQKMVAKAEERWKPFSEIDFLVASKNMDAEEFAQLRAAAQDAWNDFSFYRQEMDGYVVELRNKAQEETGNRAREAVKVLSDPKTGIPGWNQKLYDDIRAFAVSEGLPQQIVDAIVEPGAIKLFHMAMQFSKGQKVTVKKVAKAAKNVVKTGKGAATTPREEKRTKALDRLRRTGDGDDAAAAFMARWGVSDE
jgi:hypothetical protein